jgi:hypothetical protein
MDRSVRWAYVPLTLALLVAPPPDAGARSRLPPGDPWDAGRGAARGVYAVFPPYIFSHNVGLVQVEVTNLGFIGNPYHDAHNFGWRGGEYLFIGGLWIGAVATDNLPHVSTALVPDELEFRPPLEAIYSIYPSFEGAPGGDRVGFSADADDDGDGRTDEDFLNGRDDDGDRKVDEDYEAISQQMLACEYWDNTQEAVEQNSEHRPLNLLVRQRSFAWSTARSNEFIGVDYRITNAGREILKNVFIGFFVDADAGPKAHDDYWVDDVVGYARLDTTIVDPAQSGPCAEVPLKLELAYIYDYPDDGERYNGGDVPGYFGTLFLGHTTDKHGIAAPERVKVHSMVFFSGDQPYPLGDPSTDLERYDLLSRGELPERGGQVTPRDYRWVMSAGPFRELLPDSSLAFQSCFVVGLGYEGMLQNAITAQRVFNGQYKDADNNPATGIGGRETCLTALPDGAAYEWRNPCDTLGTRITFRNTTCEPHTYVDNDCNRCTGVEGKEAQVHWVGTVAPASPSMNTDPELRATLEQSPGGDSQATLLWDNASELRVDPVLRRIVFEGYRLWRVDGWNRPQGSTGPSPEDWQLVKEFETHPKDGLGAASPHYLGHIVDSTAVLIETVETGDPTQPYKPHYEVGRYRYVDAMGLKNGMIYFFDVTAFSRWKEPVGGGPIGTIPDSIEFELGGRPSALEEAAVIPRWSAGHELDDVIVVPNPYVAGRQPAGWDLAPSDSDPTGTRLAFARLPEGRCTIRIFTLAGDLVRSLEHDTRTEGGTAFWNLVTRNGQDIVSGVYLYAVQSEKGAKRGRFVIVR